MAVSDFEAYPVNFGALKPLPLGFWVGYHPNLEHYIAHGPDEWESVITCDRFQARWWCFDKAQVSPLAADK